MNRIKKNDSVAMTEMGRNHLDDKEYGKAVEYFTRAAELGDMDAHCLLGSMYYTGGRC